MLKLAVLIASASIVLSSCGTPNTSQSPAHMTFAPEAQNGDIEAAIQSSLRYLKWKTLEQGEGYVIAKVGNLQWTASSKVQKRDPITAAAQDKIRTATAKITFDDNSYSINYISSKGMDGGSDNHIWKRWVRNLDRDIRIGIGLPPVAD